MAEWTPWRVGFHPDRISIRTPWRVGFHPDRYRLPTYGDNGIASKP
ncbi:MAG: hypothetical protein N3D11_15270 [Candidatus Sumerlaeia bacterium]|nr:hypothetical protein [Candidatus Sumerlaeia bacterium]